MQTITTIGLDLAKSVFQVHGVDAGGQVIVRRQLKRRYVVTFFQKQSPCLVGIEACASAHHWSRELQALGHKVRLIPPAYVKPHVKRQKNDAADAEAICEAVTRANMRFVPTKTQSSRVAWCCTARDICLSVSRPRRLMQSGPIFPSLGSLHRSGVTVLRNCSMSWPISNDKRVPEKLVRVCRHSELNCAGSRTD